jgi:glucose-1-phosphate cytidylyltransferase
LTKFHTQKGVCATVTLAHPSSRFGIAELDGSGLITGFREKPILDELVSIGFFAFSPEIFSYVKRNSVLETSPLSLLAEQGQLSGFVHRGFWQPIDTYRELLIMQRHWESGSPPWHEPLGERE